MHELLQIVEVDPEDKVRCCAPDCHRSVYKRIHVVRESGEIFVLGETCYRLIYKNIESTKSSYFGGSSRKLSSEERILLIENTEALIAKFEQEHQLRLKASSAARHVMPKVEQQLSSSSGVPQVFERHVTCLYCGARMPTNLKFTPAKGFKCAQCKENNVSLPPTNRGRYRR